MNAGALEVGMVYRPLNSKAEAFILEEVELLERKDLLKPLADLLKKPTASFLARFWAATF